MAFQTLGDLFTAVPSLIKMRGWRSIYRMVCGHLRYPKLRIVMSFHPLLIGGNPFAVTCAYALINSLERTWGVHSAMGGTGALVTGLVGLIEGQGGRVRCGQAVEEILVEDGAACGVRLSRKNSGSMPVCAGSPKNSGSACGSNSNMNPTSPGVCKAKPRPISSASLKKRWRMPSSTAEQTASRSRLHKRSLSCISSFGITASAFQITFQGKALAWAS